MLKRAVIPLGWRLFSVGSACEKELARPFTLDCCLALQLQAQFNEERDSSREILDHNGGVTHPVDRHATQCTQEVPPLNEQRAGPDQRYAMGRVGRAPSLCYR